MTGYSVRSIRRWIKDGKSVDEIMQPKDEGYSKNRALRSHYRQVAINQKARDAGMSYGQYQAMKYLEMME